MTEKRFLSYVLTEGILLTILGLAMLMLPKVTTITFGMMICLAFIIYGGYKAINAILTRNYTRHFILNIILGLILMALGIFLFMAPMFNLVLITSIIGVYFLLESVSTCAFAIQNRKTLYFWWADIPVAAVSYTHLDVYKRQTLLIALTPDAINLFCIQSGEGLILSLIHILTAPDYF